MWKGLREYLPPLFLVRSVWMQVPFLTRLRREMMPLEGQQIGRYRLLRILGSGGMGEVYLATDTLINRQVAIKVIKAEGLSFSNTHVTKEANRLFQPEMKAITTLDHPHILPVFDYGENRLN